MIILNNSITEEYMNFVYWKYLRNCGFALRAVPNGTVPSNPNKYVTMLQNSQKGNGKRVFGNKTATPSATLRSHSATLRSGRNTLGKRNPKFAYRRTSLTPQTLCDMFDKKEVEKWDLYI